MYIFCDNTFSTFLKGLKIQSSRDEIYNYPSKKKKKEKKKLKTVNPPSSLAYTANLHVPKQKKSRDRTNIIN